MSSGIEMIGNWASQVKNWAEKRQQAVVEAALGPLTAIADDIRQEVRSDIALKRIGGPPLSASTVRRKGHSIALIETTEYINSIKVTVHRKVLGKKLVIRIAPATEATQLKAVVHEYGSPTANVPARPHWRPALQRIRNSAQYRKFLAGKWYELEGRRVAD